MTAECAALHDKYEVRALLGRGATSSVWLAEDPFAHREVAIKLFAADILHDAEHGALYRRLIATEASLAGKLRHPHIVGIYDAALRPDMSYIVMESVRGETLEAHARADRLLPVETVIEIVFKCALALDFAAATASSTATSSRRTSCSATMAT